MLSSNIRKLYISRAIRWSLLLMPVMVFFFQDRGLDMTQIFLLQSIFWIAVVFLEIPTWYIWDILRRKDWLIIWAIFSVIWRWLFYFSWWFWWLVCAEIALALWYTFNSWSDTALLYDSLMELWKQDEFKKIQWKFSSAWNFAEAWWAIIWWWLATYSFETVALAQTIVSVFWLLIAVTFIEPKREKFKVEETWFKHLLWLVKYALYTHSKISSIIIYSSITWLATMIWVRLAQPYREQIWVPLSWFWILRAACNASVWIFSLITHKIETYISEKNLLISFAMLLVLTYIILWSFPVIRTLPVIIIFYATRGISWVVYSDIINKLSSSKERATIMSVKSLAFRWVFAIMWPIVWYISDVFTIETAFIISAGIIWIFATWSLLLLKRAWYFDVE